MTEASVQGAEQFGALSRALKEAGRKDLRSELFRGLNRATKPVKDAIRQSAKEVLPKRGGLGVLVSESKMTTKRRAGRNPSIRIQSKSERDIAAMNRGRLRHPTYGHRPWVNQAVPRGWWDRPVEKSSEQIRRDLIEVMDDVARRLESSV